MIQAVSATLLSLAIFLSAFLLFQVEPMTAKYLLPWFGGGAAVWSTCLLFFQCFLLLGYASARFLEPRWQGELHLLLAGGSNDRTSLLPILRSRGNEGMSQNRDKVSTAENMAYDSSLKILPCAMIPTLNKARHSKIIT
jgi:hypothetical protein